MRSNKYSQISKKLNGFKRSWFKKNSYIIKNKEMKKENKNKHKILNIKCYRRKKHKRKYRKKKYVNEKRKKKEYIYLPEKRN